jgi:hypothetical protein
MSTPSSFSPPVVGLFPQCILGNSPSSPGPLFDLLAISQAGYFTGYFFRDAEEKKSSEKQKRHTASFLVAF